MSQKRQTTEEVMAAREAMEEKLPENVTPLPFADLDLPDFEPFDDADLPSAEEVQKSLEEAMEANVQAPEETQGMDVGSDDGSKTVTTIQIECPCCGAQILADNPEDAIQLCKCSGAKVLRQESETNEEIDANFGPESKNKFGIDHTPDELMIMKLIAAYVAKRKIKAVTITLNGNDKAIVLIKKDATVVRHTRTIKAESEV